MTQISFWIFQPGLYLNLVIKIILVETSNNFFNIAFCKLCIDAIYIGNIESQNCCEEYNSIFQMPEYSGDFLYLYKFSCIQYFHL